MTYVTGFQLFLYVNHDTGEYIKPTLNERFKTVEGCKVQRDLYSAFLIYHTDDTLTAPELDERFFKLESKAVFHCVSTFFLI